MSIITGEIQPVATGTWIAQDTGRKEVQAIAPVAKTEGGASAKLGENKTKNEDSAILADPDLPVQIADQLQSFLKETMGMELKFVVNNGGRTVVQVRDKNSGEVIRQIPPENLIRVRDKLEELRGILYDGTI
ncbi:MAG: flagellar protein FlaG [Syntrophobacteraceae bacterium]